MEFFRYTLGICTNARWEEKNAKGKNAVRLLAVRV